MRSTLHLLLLVLSFVACSPGGDDPRLNQPDPIGVLRQAATCPNGGDVAPPPRAFGSGIDAYAQYDGQSTCNPTAKPGVIAFRDLLLATYPCTTNGGISRDCSVGGTSEHKEGRAFDWMINVGHPAADAMLDWLLGTDTQGNAHAIARRVGIMYIVWNRQMWRAYRPADGWQPYSGSNPHTDHVHLSFSWAGANKQTSYWTAPSTCQPKCEGSKITNADCGVGDCGVYGARCVDDQLGVRCAFYMCPDQGEATVCVTDQVLGHCKDGQLEQTECSKLDGVFCDMTGTTKASCVSPECAGSSQQVTRNRPICLPDGRIARCDAGARLEDARACPGGNPCALYEGLAACAAPPPITGEDGISEGSVGGGGRIGVDGDSSVEGGCELTGAPPSAGAGLPWLLLGLWRAARRRCSSRRRQR